MSVPLPLAATMLKLLRLPLFRSLRVENSRNPGLRLALALISPILSIISGSRLARFMSHRHDRQLCLHLAIPASVN
jgi:hypothetical protein